MSQRQVWGKGAVFRQHLQVLLLNATGCNSPGNRQLQNLQVLYAVTDCSREKAVYVTSFPVGSWLSDQVTVTVSVPRKFFYCIWNRKVQPRERTRIRTNHDLKKK